MSGNDSPCCQCNQIRLGDSVGTSFDPVRVHGKKSLTRDSTVMRATAMVMIIYLESGTLCMLIMRYSNHVFQTV